MAEKEPKKGMHWLKQMFIVFLLMGAAYGGGVFHQYQINKQNPVIQKEDVVKFVEKSKTETKDFLMHLNKDLDPFVAEIIADAVDKFSAKYRLPRKLVCAIIRKESNIDPKAESKVGAVGLMQVMPKIHKDKYVGRNLWHIHTNVETGCMIFREYLDMEKGNMHKTFHRYLSKNASQVQVDKYAGGIYKFWAQLEMFDYLSTAEREQNKDQETNGDEEVKTLPLQIESQIPEPLSLTKE